MKLGFSTGALFKVNENKNSNKSIEQLANISTDVIEISLLDINDLEKINQINKDLLGRFAFKSLHAPALDWEYKNNTENHRLLNDLIDLTKTYNFNIVVFHPDRIKDYNFLNKFLHELPITIENMNSNKNAGKTIAELSEIFDTWDFKMLLDLQHAYSNDSSLDLVQQIYNKFKNRIIAYHISGQTEKPGQHTTLFTWKQTNIIKAIPNVDLPTIIESPISSIGDLKNEYNYISKYINQTLPKVN